MGITALDPPVTERKRTHEFSPEDAKEALTMLDNDQAPGNGPYKTAGIARSAANALIAAVERYDDETVGEFGSRVWEQEDGAVAKRGHYFVLKAGRRKHPAETADESTDESTD